VDHKDISLKGESGMSLFALRHSDGHDDPSWPGLVDIFAFTLVLVVFLMAAALEQPSREDSIRADEKLKEEFEKSKIVTAEEGLKKNIPEESVSSPVGQREITIQGPENKQISFLVNQYDLGAVDVLRLQRIANALNVEVVKNDLPVVITIDGRADPREFQRSIPPRDNTELSALRAAFVARTIIQQAPNLSDYLRIVGLGVQGEMAPAGMSQEAQEQHYAFFRRVSIHVGLDERRLDQQFRKEHPLDEEQKKAIENAENDSTEDKP
jgi:hypothetical protein